MEKRFVSIDLEYGAWYLSFFFLILAFLFRSLMI